MAAIVLAVTSMAPSYGIVRIDWRQKCRRMAEQPFRAAAGKEDIKKILSDRGMCEGTSVCVTSGSVGRVMDINPARGIVTIETDYFNRRQKFQLDWKI